jgi:hypothetical protein
MRLDLETTESVLDFIAQARAAGVRRLRVGDLEFEVDPPPYVPAQVPAKGAHEVLTAEQLLDKEGGETEYDPNQLFGDG